MQHFLILDPINPLYILFPLPTVRTEGGSSVPFWIIPHVSIKWALCCRFPPLSQCSASPCGLSWGDGWIIFFGFMIVLHFMVIDLTLNWFPRWTWPIWLNCSKRACWQSFAVKGDPPWLGVGKCENDLVGERGAELAIVQQVCGLYQKWEFV